MRNENVVKNDVKGNRGFTRRLSFPKAVVGNLHLVYEQSGEDPRTLRAAKPRGKSLMNVRQSLTYCGMTNAAGGFTLVELLVVVLIIGILAAVALPQYNKAVQKSRNATLKQVVKAIADAEVVYFLANGTYAANFSELDIDLPLTPVATTAGGHAGACRTTTQGTDSIRQGKDYYVTLNSTAEQMTSVNVTAYWDTGKYKCAGFGFNVNLSAATLGRLHCREMKPTSYYTANPGDFCEKIEHGTQLDIDQENWRFYSLP